jgi:ATP-dependent NAD(P)H-hydrate dehydratase
MQSCARIAFELAKEMDQLGVVVDADGLWLVQVSPISLSMLFENRLRD